jgi:2-polyprenyl-3-methyl-5-hydroxy-6-metoxy-1,4-benzoquinol methylase
VVLADITGAPTLEFLKWRKQHREVPDRAIQFREFSTPVPDFEHPVDCVLLMSMLDHCPDAYGTLEWAIRQLSPGGLLLCDYATHTHQEKELEPQHLITYDQHTLVQWLHERGMEESYKYPWMFTKRG